MPARKLIGFLAALVISTAVFANANSPLRPNHPQEYTVVKGDTLWDIAERFLNSPWLWPEIWYANPDIENPHLIYPGDKIKLVYIEGKPRLTVQRGAPGGVVKLSPKARSTPIDQAIDTIPMAAIRPFLTQTRIVDAGVLENAPYVVAAPERRVMGSASDRVYVRGTDAADGQGFDIVRRGKEYRDPKTNKLLGVEARNLGEGLIQRSGDPATLLITRSNREVLKGDRLLPVPEEAIPSQFFPRAPDHPVKGQILSVLDGVNEIGQYNVVAINLGRSDGMKVGDVLAVLRKGEVIRDTVGDKGRNVKLPNERAGEMIVFRTFGQVSYGLIMRAQREMQVGDIVQNP